MTPVEARLAELDAELDAERRAALAELDVALNAVEELDAERRAALAELDVALNAVEECRAVSARVQPAEAVAAEVSVARARMIDDAVARRIEAWQHIFGPVTPELQEQFTVEEQSVWDAQFPELAATARTVRRVA